ncbi:MAG: hypothetical protein ACLQBX_05355, partial [Candidatus Limnocylindrales bacterium]
ANRIELDVRETRRPRARLRIWRDHGVDRVAEVGVSATGTRRSRRAMMAGTCLGNDVSSKHAVSTTPPTPKVRSASMTTRVRRVESM